MKLAGWQLVVVLLALVALIGVLGWRGVLTGTELGLAFATVAAYLSPSPLNTRGQGPVSMRPPPPAPVVITEKKDGQ